VALAAAVAFFGDGPRVIVRSAVTGLAVGRADAVSILRDLGGGPMKLGQGRNDAGDNAGFANTARMSANNNQGHGDYFSLLRVSRDTPASSFRYCLIGRAGVPQKTTPLPRIVLFDGMPLWAPRITPGSMVT